MKTAPAMLLMAAALAPTALSAADQEPCGPGRAPGRHLYAFAYFYNGAPDAPTARVIGNAFAIHAVALSACNPDADCETTGRSRWRILFATAAHVVRDVCALNKAKPGKIELVVPARPMESSTSYRASIDSAFCDANAEAENYSNDLLTITRDDGRATNAKTLNDDDIRKNSDQWFFAADIETPDNDIVLPVMIGPLRKPPTKSDPIPLRSYAFQNAPVEGGKPVEEGVWWTESGRDYGFVAEKINSAYQANDWTTLKGASGSPVLEVLGSDRLAKVRAVGITTQFAYPGCTKAAGASRPADSDIDLASSSDETAMTVDDLARCLNDPATGQRASAKTTTFIPVLRFPPQLQARFVQLSSSSGGPRSVYSWTRSPELLIAIRSLIRGRQRITSLNEQEKVDQAIKFLADDIPPHELTFMLSGLAAPKNARQAIPLDFLSVSGCRRIEPMGSGR
ncbi:hypothetical protein [Polymorphobacter fuscus]|uniref:Trypsin-like serine protease n=1 Tax=Sandarakinorhabdus fusca TaxID=1439888 RepID=A0A7C9GPQ4_9SPHN|nr:hypothetical protein [Polymorphobacter fuscus]KAB7646491.1 hypothetical protein F9290_10735 [Polymorphobacter fuscus]MQT17735.1 hypothetical protein [Polymorphobacter fuscus]NJC09717.1 hypothetical protein [Polymorphobacter fuscus]